MTLDSQQNRPRLNVGARRRGLLITVLVFVILTCAGIYEFRQLRESLSSGYRMEGLRKEITVDLFDSVSVGLRQFYSHRGHYPSTEGKYYYDSIKQYVSVPEVYVYADSMDGSGHGIAVAKPVGESFNFHDIEHTYLGVGSSDMTIRYKRLTPDSYLLYSIGENKLDEAGGGDDVVYKH